MSQWIKFLSTAEHTSSVVINQIGDKSSVLVFVRGVSMFDEPQTAKQQSNSCADTRHDNASTRGTLLRLGPTRVIIMLLRGTRMVHSLLVRFSNWWWQVAGIFLCVTHRGGIDCTCIDCTCNQENSRDDDSAVPILHAAHSPR